MFHIAQKIDAHSHYWKCDVKEYEGSKTLKIMSVNSHEVATDYIHNLNNISNVISSFSLFYYRHSYFDERIGFHQ